MTEEMENMDLMIFDYLEGNLNDQQANDLLDQVASNTYLKAELIAWKNTYIESEHYDTKKIESAIIRTTFPPFNITNFLNFLLIGCLTLVSSVQPSAVLNNGIETSFPELHEIENIITISEQSAPSPTKYISTENMPREANGKDIDSDLLVNSMQLNVGFIDPLRHNLDLTYDPSIPNVDILFIYRNITAHKPKNQYQLIDIPGFDKYIIKGARSNKKDQFIKGGKPYVVPLNTQNF